MTTPSSADNSFAPIQTFYGYVETLDDALLIFKACSSNQLKKVEQKPTDAPNPTSGAVYVWDAESGISRWRDSKKWSPSRIQNNFLVYRELLDQNKIKKYERKKKGNYKLKEQGLIKKTMSLWLEKIHYHMVCYHKEEDVFSGKLKKYESATIHSTKTKIELSLGNPNKPSTPSKSKADINSKKRAYDIKQVLPNKRNKPSPTITKILDSSKFNVDNYDKEQPQHLEIENIKTDITIKEDMAEVINLKTNPTNESPLKKIYQEIAANQVDESDNEFFSSTESIQLPQSKPKQPDYISYYKSYDPSETYIPLKRSKSRKKTEARIRKFWKSLYNSVLTANSDGIEQIDDSEESDYEINCLTSNDLFTFPTCACLQADSSSPLIKEAVEEEEEFYERRHR